MNTLLQYFIFQVDNIHIIALVHVCITTTILILGSIIAYLSENINNFVNDLYVYKQKYKMFRMYINTYYFSFIWYIVVPTQVELVQFLNQTL